VLSNICSILNRKNKYSILRGRKDLIIYASYLYEYKRNLNILKYKVIIYAYWHSAIESERKKKNLRRRELRNMPSCVHVKIIASHKITIIIIMFLRVEKKPAFKIIQ